MCLQPVEYYIYIYISYGLITAPQIKGKILKQKNINMIKIKKRIHVNLLGGDVRW